MAQTTRRLTSKGVEHLKTPGLHHDGDGLYLQVKNGSRSWIYRYRSGGRLRDMGLGSAATTSLAEARRAAGEARRLRRDAKDPIIARREARIAQAASEARSVPFLTAARDYITTHSAGWKNDKHVAQWRMTVLGETPDGKPTKENPCAPLHPLPVSAVDTAAVLQVLKPIWSTKTETASRLRGRIEAVLDAAAAHGLRTGENPARWRGHLDKLLPAKSKVKKKRHHPALPYAQVPAFMASLRSQLGIGSCALEFTILTAARSGEVLGMRWSEVDEVERVWTIPGERMKGNREHRVPLTEPALAILAEMRDAFGDQGFVFLEARAGEPLSDMAMTETIRRMNETADPKWMDPRQGRAVVPHGFRSTFRDWVADETNFPGDLAEMALAHALEDETEAAYRRGDQFEKRRKLMAAWAEYAGDGAQGRS